MSIRLGTVVYGKMKLVEAEQTCAELPSRYALGASSFSSRLSPCRYKTEINGTTAAGYWCRPEVPFSYE